MVKHISKYHSESVIYFNLGSAIIKENCNFVYYFNKTDIKPTFLDGGNEIILANWLSDKHMVCNVNNDIPVEIPSFPCILVNKSVLCNCGIEAENNFLLQSIAACHYTKSELVMYFTVNMAFINYFDNLTESLEVPILQKWNTHQQDLTNFFATF